VNVGFGIAEPPAYHQSLLEAFSEKCPQLGNSSYLLFLSRIHEKKGLDLLIEAYRNVLYEVKESKTALVLVDSKGEEFSDTPAPQYEFPKLVIAGPGLQTPYGQYIQKMVAENPDLRKSVYFPGMLTGDAKWGAFYGCEAFVLPSHQENFGIAVVEALACSRPVMISNQVNIWREIESMGGGFIADDTLGQTQQMLEKWQSISQAEKNDMGFRARNTFEKFFSIGPAVKKLMCTINPEK
jgi:glycosyltransferase involved in cell wall biosynthesis